MLNITDIEDALYEWVFGITNVKTIFAHPNAPRPKGQPYILIHIVQNVPVGIAESEYTLLGDNSIDIDHSNVEDIFVSINTYRGNAHQLATKLKDSLARVTVTDQLFSAGLGYSRASFVQDIPEEINKRWEERAQFDCFFFTRSLDEENIETIQKIEITNELDGTTTVVEKPSP